MADAAPVLDSELTDADIAAKARENHIWLNAMACVRPTDGFLLDVGRQVVSMLNDSEVSGDLLGVKIGKVLYLRVNKS